MGRSLEAKFPAPVSPPQPTHSPGDLTQLCCVVKGAEPSGIRRCHHGPHWPSDCLMFGDRRQGSPLLLTSRHRRIRSGKKPGGGGPRMGGTRMGRGSAAADSKWQPPAGSPPWVGCQSRPAGFPENSFPMSSDALVGHPTHSREPLSRDPRSLHAPLLRALTLALTHTRKSTLSVLGSQELRQGLHFPSPHTLIGVFCFFQTLGGLLCHTKGAEWEYIQKTGPQATVPVTWEIKETKGPPLPPPNGASQNTDSGLEPPN